MHMAIYEDEVARVKSEFQRAVAIHAMTIEMDCGVHRCISFNRPNSGICAFRLVTWPGSLAFTGDMGDFIFSRMHDMFQFFSSEPNFCYWSEKLQAVDRNGGFYEFSGKAYIDAVREWTVDDPDTNIKIEEFEAVKEHGYEAAMAFAIDKLGYDFTECCVYEPTYHYVWACYAIPWGIEMYRRGRTAGSPRTTGVVQ